MAQQGGPGGGGGGGGGPGGPGGGGTGGGGGMGDLYGDLYVILRDLTANGAPELDENLNEILIGSDGEPIYRTSDGEILPDDLPYVQEVEFSRLSVIRSPDRVIDKALDEVLNKLAGATEVDTDPAGRLMLDGVTVDAPLENLALYEHILNNLGSDELRGVATFETAASLFGAAADKTTPITIDTVVYSDTILGLNPVNTSGEVEYYNFGSPENLETGDPAVPGYDYTRMGKYGGEENQIIWYEGDADNNGQLDSHTGTVLDAVFDGNEWDDLTPDPYSIDDFSQAADDTRAVINFMHTYMAEPYVGEDVVTPATLAYGLGYGMAYGADGDCPLADGTCPLLV